MNYLKKKKDNGDMAVHRMLDLLSSSLRERVSHTRNHDCVSFLLPCNK